jgi:CBS domain-containing protein
MESWLSKVGLGSLNAIFESKEVKRRTLFSAIEDDDLLNQAVAEAERVVGGFDRPGSGLLLVLPTIQVLGLEKVKPKRPEETSPPAVIPDWLELRNRPVEEAVAVMNLEPTIVHQDTALDETALALLAHPDVHVACVVAEDGRLVGLLRLRDLADDIFFHIMPEEFLSEIHDLEKAEKYAHLSKMRTVSDAMVDPVWVKQDETLKTAFKRMHEHRLTGLPVVDGQYRVVGYINLLELLALSLPKEEEINGSDEER